MGESLLKTVVTRMGDVLQGMASLAHPCGDGLWSRVRCSLFMVLQSDIWEALPGHCAYSPRWFCSFLALTEVILEFLFALLGGKPLLWHHI